MRLLTIALASASLTATLGLSTLPAFAAGGGGSTQTCPRGQVYDSATNACVDQQSGVVSDRDLSNNAFALADEGRYDEALALIAARTGEHDVLSLTARGYTIRKSGDVEGSLCYYMDAITLDSSDTRPRQYLGEAYVQLGVLDMAHEQLDAIAARVGTDHPHYTALAAMIEAAS